MCLCIVLDFETESCHSNSQGSIILDVLRYARIKPQVLQVELHPYLTQEHLVELANTLDIRMTAYSSFGPQSYIELNADRGASSLLTHDVVTGLASQYKKSGSICDLPKLY
jgi:D-xylose reductase